MTRTILNGKRVLVVMLDSAIPHNVYLRVGVGRWNGSELELVSDDGKAWLSLTQFDIERNGFQPEVLARLVAKDEHLPVVERLAEDVVHCVALLVQTAPAEAVAMPGMLGGVAMGRDGSLFLMQVR